MNEHRHGYLFKILSEHVGDHSADKTVNLFSGPRIVGRKHDRRTSKLKGAATKLVLKPPKRLAGSGFEKYPLRLPQRLGPEVPLTHIDDDGSNDFDPDNPNVLVVGPLNRKLESIYEEGYEPERQSRPDRPRIGTYLHGRNVGESLIVKLPFVLQDWSATRTTLLSMVLKVVQSMDATYPCFRRPLWEERNEKPENANLLLRKSAKKSGQDSDSTTVRFITSERN